MKVYESSYQRNCFILRNEENGKVTDVFSDHAILMSIAEGCKVDLNLFNWVDQSRIDFKIWKEIELESFPVRCSFVKKDVQSLSVSRSLLILKKKYVRNDRMKKTSDEMYLFNSN